MTSQKKGGWGSILSGAVANLESRLDTILADDGQASARERTAAEEAVKQAKAARTRVNESLAERLARATQSKQSPSRSGTPVNDPESSRASFDIKRNDVPSVEATSDAVSEDVEEKVAQDVDNAANGDEPNSRPLSTVSGLLNSALPINPARLSIDSRRVSVDLSRDVSSRPSLDFPNGAISAGKSNTELLVEMNQMREAYEQAEIQRQEEMHAYLERIDALQSKLTYLAKETVAAAREANSAGSSEAQLAEKDAQIALLMEEGVKLSKSEMRQIQTIKKLRNKATEDEKSATELLKKNERSQRLELELKVKLRKAEVGERQANEKVRQIAVIEKEVDELREDRENAAELIRSLTTQLKAAKEQAEKSEKEATIKVAEADKSTAAKFETQLEDARIEKKLAEDRGASEARRLKEDAERQRDRWHVKEVELKGEISGLESRLEAMRGQAEEASAGSAGIMDGESNIKLMRQVETLQQQYTLAKGNWEIIESSLNARVVALEKERDSAHKRESEARKKARDTGTRSRKVEEDLESTTEQVQRLERELKSRQEVFDDLTVKYKLAEKSAMDTKSDFEKQRKLWEAETLQRIEEEKQKWQRENMSASPAGFSRVEYSGIHSRKPSNIDLNSQARRLPHRLGSYDTNNSDPRTPSRRQSAMPAPALSSRSIASPIEQHSQYLPQRHQSPSSTLPRRESSASLEATTTLPTPSIDINHNPMDDFEDSASAQRTINDLVSTSVAGSGGGPSVQLVERMSALVRKLETEKASFKDELARLNTQRDNARNEVVELMREVDEKKQLDDKVRALQKEMEGLEGRYEASLEMLGEREEEVAELKMDIDELKGIYRELVEAKISDK